MNNAIILALIVVIGGIGIYLFTSSDSAPAPDSADFTEPAATSMEDESTMAEGMDEAPASTEAEPMMETEPTIVDIAAGNENFSTLVTAVTEAGLVETLQGEGPFTVFAPTDEAFAALPAGTLDSLLLEENRADLTGILTYHVVPGAVLSGDLTDGMTVETVNGQTLTIGVTETGVTVNGANVVTADLEASNGVIHVVDSVLLPE